jgi:hypothetical protein
VSVKQKDYFRFDYSKLKTLRVLWVLEYEYCVKLRDSSEESIASIFGSVFLLLYSTNKCTALLASKQPQNLYDIYLMLYVQS